MTQVIALSVSIAVLGGIWAFLALGPLSGFVLVWAGFIGWGCFFHSGANNNALVKTIVGNAYGALVAWVALLIIVNVPVPGLGAVWSAIVVGVTVFFLVIVASIDLRSVVPANVYGYAALVAYSLHQPSAAPATGPLQNLVSPSFANALVLLIVSMVIGALFGDASGAAHKTADHGGARITEARRFVPGPSSGIDSVPRSMDNRSRRPVDFRYMASARKAPPD
jgi:hypothetical protein